MTITVPFVDLVAQYETIADEIDRAFDETTSSAQYILGDRVERFEEEFAAFVGSEAGVGVGNGLDALRLGLLGLGIGPGDEVIIPANTYIATAFAVSDVGADVVLVDCDPRTYNIDPAAVDAALTSKTSALIPVHLAGRSAEMRPLMGIARAGGFEVVEDAAQAHGAEDEDVGVPCGSIGRLACFSFYPGKNLGAYGDAGMVTTSDAEIAQRIRRLRNYGERRKYDHVVKGVNSRLDALQASFLSVKLRHLRDWNASRRERAAAYRAQLEGVGDIVVQDGANGSTHVYHLFIIETENRDALRDFLSERGIQTGIHYPIPIHLQEAYEELGFGEGAFPVTERLAKQSLSLPMFAELTDEQLAHVTGAIREFFDSGGEG